MHPWLQDLRHDLIKHGLFCARDLRDLGFGTSRPAGAGEVAALRRSLFDLRDGEGNRVSAGALFQALREQAGAAFGGDPPAAPLDAFAAAVGAAEQAVLDLGQHPERLAAAIDQVLALEAAFAALARDLERSP